MSQQLQHLGAVRATLVLLLTAAGTFAALLLLVGNAGTAQPTPVPRPVSALQTSTSAATSRPTRATPVKAKSKSSSKHHLDSFERLAQAQTRRAREQLREARKRTLGPPARTKPKVRRPPSVGGGTVAPGQTTSGLKTPQTASSTAPAPTSPKTKAPVGTTPAPPTAAPQTTTQIGNSAPDPGGTKAQ